MRKFCGWIGQNISFAVTYSCGLHNFSMHNYMHNLILYAFARKGFGPSIKIRTSCFHFSVFKSVESRDEICLPHWQFFIIIKTPSLLVGKFAKKAVWMSVFLTIWHCILIADSTKTHSSSVAF